MPDTDLQTVSWAPQEDRLEERRQEVRTSYEATGASSTTRELLRRYVNDALALAPDVEGAVLAGQGPRQDLATQLGAELGLQTPDPVIGTDIAGQLDAFATQRSIASNDPAQQAVRRSAGRVDLLAGQATYEATDLVVRGAGIDFAFRRTYGSQCAYRGPLGANWNHPYNLWLREIGGDLLRSVRALREDSFVRHPSFGQAGFDFWVPPDGQVGIMRAGVGAVSFIWQGPGGQEVMYKADPARPLLHRASRIADRFGNALDLVYDVAGLLQEIRVNSSARRVQFTYDSEDRIIALRDYTGRVCRYDYDDFGDLVAVTSPATDVYPPGLTTVYEYSSAVGPVIHNLERVIDARGRLVLENDFGQQPGTLNFNRVIRQRRGAGETLFEYETVSHEFDFDYSVEDRPAIQVNEVARNGRPVHVVLNKTGNLLLREEAVFEEGRQRLLQWRFRHDRDGRTVAALSPEGSLEQRLYGREYFLRKYDITDEEARFHPALTDSERLAFGNLLAVVRRGRRHSLASLDLSKGVWGPIYPDVLAAQVEDVVVKAGYEPDFQQVVSISDARFTGSPDPQAVESPQYFATLTRREYTGPSSQPTLLLRRIRYPDKTQPDGTTFTNIREEFEYAGKGRLRRRRDAGGTVTEYDYYGVADGVREGYLRSTTRESTGLAVRTEQDTDPRGWPAVIRHPRSIGAPGGRFVTKVEVNELDQVVRVESSPPFAFVTRWSYDRGGRIERVERPLLDESGAPVLGGLGVERYGYDAEGNTVAQTLGGLDPRSELAVRHRYDAAGLRRLTVSPGGRRTTRRYDERMREATVTSGAGTPEATTVRIQYDGDDRPILRRSGRGFATRYRYDPLGRLAAIVDPLGNLTLRDYDKAGDLLVERRFERRADGSFALMARTETTYDEHHQPVRVGENLFAQPIPVADTVVDHRASPGPGRLLMTENYFDVKGRLERVVDPLGNVRRTEFDALDRVTAQVDGEGNRSEIRYDAHDNVVRRDDRELIRDPATGAVIGEEFFPRAYAYDELDRLSSQTDGLGNVTTFEYDSRGRLSVIRDPLGNVKRITYDIYGRLEQEQFERTTSGLGGGVPSTPVVVNRAYDPDGNLVGYWDPGRNFTEQRFDSVGRRHAIIYSDGSQEDYAYDRDSNLVAAVDANGVRRTLVPDELGRVASVTVDASAAPYPVEGESLEAYTYDGLGRRVSERNDYLHVATTVDSLGRATAETWQFLGVAAGPTPLTLAREFDDVGALVGLTFPDGRVVRYHRDALSRVGRVENVANGVSYPGSSAFTGSYDIELLHHRGGRRERSSFGNGTGSAFAYDAAARLSEIVHTDGADAPLLTLQYLTDAVGNVRVRNERGPASAAIGERFGYDSMYQLAHITRSNSIPVFNAAAFAPATKLPADPVPNRQTAIDAAIGGLALNPGNRTIVYDDAGNRLTEQRPGQPPIVYVPNALNQYTSIAGTQTTYDLAGNLRTLGNHRFVYDSRNRLVRVEDGPSGTDVVRFFHDASGRRIAEERAGARTHLVWDRANPLEEYRGGVLRVQYAHDDSLDSVCQMVHSGGEYWLHRDAIGTPRVLTDENGAAVGGRRHGPFGALEQQTGPYNPLGFAGQRFDVDVSLSDMRTRTYSPEIGRFVQRDPKGIPGGWNLYGYALNNPLTYTDPMGTDPLGERTVVSDFAADEIVGKGTTESLIATAAAAARQAWDNGDVEAARYYGAEVNRLAGQLVHEGQVGMAKFGAVAYFAALMNAIGGHFFGAAGAALATKAQFGATATFVTAGAASGFGSTLYGEVALMSVGKETTPTEFLWQLGVGTAGGALMGGLGALKYKSDLPVGEGAALGSKAPSFAARARATGSPDPDIDAIVEGIGPSPKAEGIPLKITLVETTNARLKGLLEVAESGGARWVAGDPELYAAYEAALPAVGGAQGRAGYNVLRRGMGELLEIPRQPIHHWRFPIKQYGSEAVSATNLYLADDTSLHIALHKAIGTRSSPFAEMAWGVEPEVQSMFNFMLAPP